MNGKATISFTVEPAVQAGLTRRAQALGYTAGFYARMLFEAAYAARVRGERDEEALDKALDTQVRRAFLLADCEPEYIALALGVPAERVARILEAWRMVLGGTGGGGAVAAVTPKRQLADPSGVEPPPPPVPPARQTARKAYDQATVDTIVRLYNAGQSSRTIADAVGRPKGSIEVWLSKHRDLCPRRHAGAPDRAAAIRRPADLAAGDGARA